MAELRRSVVAMARLWDADIFGDLSASRFILPMGDGLLSAGRSMPQLPLLTAGREGDERQPPTSVDSISHLQTKRGKTNAR